MGEAFEGIQTAEPDRGFITAELFDSLGVQLGYTALGRVLVGQEGGDFLVVLAAEGEHEADSCARSAACG